MNYRGSEYDMEPSNLPQYEGKRVRLPPDKEEGWAEAFGHIRSADEFTRFDGHKEIMLVIDLETPYLEGLDDDGLREVSLDQVEFVDES